MSICAITGSVVRWWLEGLHFRGDTVVAGIGRGRVHRWRGYLFDAGPQHSVDVEVGPVLPPDFQDATFEDFEAVFVSELLEGWLSVAVHLKSRPGTVSG